jgi:hypothetical protein
MAKQPDPPKVKVLKRIKINKTLISGDKKVTDAVSAWREKSSDLTKPIEASEKACRKLKEVLGPKLGDRIEDGTDWKEDGEGLAI